MNHHLWLVGFRPFFILAFISGALLPLIWALGYAGLAPFPQTGLTPIQWHAHEMLYGFGWAVMGGFLLTASKNWVSVRGMHGPALMLASLLWLMERAAVALMPGNAPAWIRFTSLNLFLLYIVGYVVWTLAYHRKKDTFQDNYLFIVALPLFLVAKNMTLSEGVFASGIAMTIGLFRVAFVVMFERTMTQFMKNAMGVSLFRSPYLDVPIKILILIAAFQAFLPVPVAAAVLGLAASLLLLRLLLWSPLKGLRVFGIAIMYIGYLGLVLHLFFEIPRITGVYTGIGALSTHVFTFLCMGFVIPGMLIRISQGHTGRKLQFTISDRLAILTMGLASFSRLIATQIWPTHYSLWIALSGFGWTICFSMLGYRLIPFLLKPRVDGRTH